MLEHAHANLALLERPAHDDGRWRWLLRGLERCQVGADGAGPQEDVHAGAVEALQAVRVAGRAIRPIREARGELAAHLQGRRAGGEGTVVQAAPTRTWCSAEAHGWAQISSGTHVIKQVLVATVAQRALLLLEKLGQVLHRDHWAPPLRQPLEAEPLHRAQHDGLAAVGSAHDEAIKSPGRPVLALARQLARISPPAPRSPPGGRAPWGPAQPLLGSHDVVDVLLHEEGVNMALITVLERKRCQFVH